MEDGRLQRINAYLQNTERLSAQTELWCASLEIVQLKQRFVMSELDFLVLFSSKKC
jgi:hypothetical protein